MVKNSEEEDDIDHVGYCIDQLIYKSSQFSCSLDLSYLSNVLDSIFYGGIVEYQITSVQSTVQGTVQGTEHVTVDNLLSEEEHINTLQQNGMM